MEVRECAGNSSEREHSKSGGVDVGYETLSPDPLTISQKCSHLDTMCTTDHMPPVFQDFLLKPHMFRVIFILLKKKIYMGLIYHA